MAPGAHAPSLPWHRWRKLGSLASSPVDAASLAALRVLLGGLLVVGLTRFQWQGWVDVLYGEPTFFFRYPGLRFVPTGDVHVVRGAYGVVTGLAFLVMVGLWTRVSLFGLVVIFTWLQLHDVTNYLNHYYLLILLLTWLLVSPAHRIFTMDGVRGRVKAVEQIPALWVWLLRLQVGLVYVYAAIAKVTSDWLVHGQPLGIWLQARDELWGLNFLMQFDATPWLMSVGGFLYDASIVPLLLWRRSRPLAYVLVLAFHGMTSMLFDIGMFPGIMACATTIFFAPSWPRPMVVWLKRPRFGRPQVVHVTGATTATARASMPHPALCAVLLVGATFQVLFPLRAALYPGPVNWGEEGMRWSWRVMVRAKSASLTYRVVLPGRGRTLEVSAHDVLTWRQANEIAGQPDLVLQLAHHLRDRFQAEGDPRVEVYADCLVSWNGRRAAPLIDPAVDLARVDDGLAPATYILPAPSEPPRSSRRKRSTGVASEP